MARSSSFTKMIRLLRLAGLSYKNNNFSLEQATLNRRQLIKAGLKTAAFLPMSGIAFNHQKAWATHQKHVSKKPVVIIGAGASGLTTAFRLREVGIPCTVYEASNRVGGRMFTLPKFNSEGMFCELGGEFVDSWHSDLMQLCQQLGLKIQRIKSENWEVESDLFVTGNRVVGGKEMLQAFLPLAAHISKDLKEIFGNEPIRTPSYLDAQSESIVKFDRLSLSEYLEQKTDVEKWVLDLVQTLYVCEFGLETHEQSALNFLTLVSSETSEKLELLGSSDESFRIEGGSSSLPNALADSIKATVPLHFGHSLICLQDTWRGLKLTFQTGNRYHEVFAHQVVCTIPFSVLRNVEGIHSLAVSPSMKKCIQEFGYGTNSKLMMGFNEKVWQTKSSVPNVGALITDTQQQFWDSSRGQPGKMGILTNFLGGELGKTIPQSQLLNNLNLLNDLFPESRDQYSHKIVHRWPSYRWSQGSYTCLKPGQYTTFNGLAAEPQLAGRLYFAGEHTSVENSGFMNGAVQSGNLTAKKIQAKLGIPVRPTRQLEPVL